MENGRLFRNSQIVVFGVCIALATIISSVIFSQGFMRLMKFAKEVISVTGSATKRIKSDYTTWQIELSRRNDTLAAAYAELKKDNDRVKNYLKSKGVAENEMIISQAYTTTLYKKNAEGNDTNEIEAYRLIQHILVNSSDVDRITRLSREITELINEGIGLNSASPNYFYTKLDELKIEMLAKATENAKQRAARMAQSTGNRIGVIRSAKMGVFQVTPPTSTEVSDYGENDTSSLEKKVMAVVSVAFSIE